MSKSQSKRSVNIMAKKVLVVSTSLRGNSNSEILAKEYRPLRFEG